MNKEAKNATKDEPTIEPITRTVFRSQKDVCTGVVEMELALFIKMHNIMQYTEHYQSAVDIQALHKRLNKVGRALFSDDIDSMAAAKLLDGIFKAESDIDNKHKNSDKYQRMLKRTERTLAVNVLD